MSSTADGADANTSTTNSTTDTAEAKPADPAVEDAFQDFYKDVKAIEQRDSVLTPKQQIDRLNRPGSTYFNLNPFDMSILVHPDKNIDDTERAQKAFEAVSKAYKTLENEEGYKRCKEIVTEARERTDNMIKEKKKKLKKEGRLVVVPEDNPDDYKHAVYVQTCKLFADLERMRKDREARESHDKKREAEEEEEERKKKKIDAEWNKNFEESREGRVHSWSSFNKSKGKKAKGTFRPPKPKMEQR